MNAETITAVPLNKLVPSAANVRRTGKEAGMEELKASIRNKGLLQNLVVRPGKKSGTFEVVAGERRRTALTQLAKGGEIAKDFPVPVRVTEGNADTDISLSENVVRVAMHDGDAVLAFAELAEKHGLSPEEIADRYGISHMTVRRRLRLAAVSPKIMELFRKDEVTTAQMFALAVTTDHAAQEAAYFSGSGWQRNADNLRAVLTKGRIALTHHLVAFVGVDAYKAGGGGIEADLFAGEGEGFILDADLLNRLAMEKLGEAVTAVKAEGWLWADGYLSCSYSELSKYDRAYPEYVALSAEDDALLSALSEEDETLSERASEEEDEHGAILPETAGRLAEVEAAVSVLQAKRERYADTALAHGGVVVTINSSDGSLDVHRGLIKADDAKAYRAAQKGAASEDDEKTALESPAAEEASSSGLSNAMVEDLSKARTHALARALADRPNVAQIVLVHGLALKRFYNYTHGKSVLTLTTTFTNLTPSKDDPENNEAVQEMAALHEAWAARLPKEAEALWQWCLDAGMETLGELLAYVVASNISVHQFQERRNVPADDLIELLQFDMADWWKPSAAFFQRNPKAVAVAALTEMGKPDAAKAAGAAKKGDAVTITVKALEDSRWLPQSLKPWPVASTAEGEDGEDGDSGTDE